MMNIVFFAVLINNFPVRLLDKGISDEGFVGLRLLKYLRDARL